jgi:hypothetical protein
MTVSDLSADVLRLMASRIEASRTVEQIIYRETELDEIWRLADLAVAGARGRAGQDAPAILQLARIATLVHAAHDAIGQSEDAAAAARALREAAMIAADMPAPPGGPA